MRSCQTFLKKKFESYQSIRTQKSGGTAPPIGWGKKAQVDIIYINGPKKRPRSAPIFSAKKPLEQNKTKHFLLFARVQDGEGAKRVLLSPGVRMVHFAKAPTLPKLGVNLPHFGNAGRK